MWSSSGVNPPNPWSAQSSSPRFCGRVCVWGQGVAGLCRMPWRSSGSERIIESMWDWSLASVPALTGSCSRSACVWKTEETTWSPLRKVMKQSLKEHHAWKNNTRNRTDLNQPVYLSAWEQDQPSPLRCVFEFAVADPGTKMATSSAITVQYFSWTFQQSMFPVIGSNLFTKRLEMQGLQLLHHLFPAVSEPAVEVGWLEELPAAEIMMEKIIQNKRNACIIQLTITHVLYFSQSWHWFNITQSDVEVLQRFIKHRTCFANHSASTHSEEILTHTKKYTIHSELASMMQLSVCCNSTWERVWYLFIF